MQIKLLNSKGVMLRSIPHREARKLVWSGECEWVKGHPAIREREHVRVASHKPGRLLDDYLEARLYSDRPQDHPAVQAINRYSAPTAGVRIDHIPERPWMG
jgi:hypothetical protein